MQGQEWKPERDYEKYKAGQPKGKGPLRVICAADREDVLAAGAPRYLIDGQGGLVDQQIALQTAYSVPHSVIFSLHQF